MGEGGGAEQAGQTGQHPRQSRLTSEKLGIVKEGLFVDYCGTQSHLFPSNSFDELCGTRRQSALVC
ncbi:hypothetical protein [Mycobacterium sp.]|uniref:hypothetical protein n=1 Tax=Mycobacterium sp. TaxID=1785 RepID=UPI003F99BAAC